ncbi:F-box protein At5g39450-like [Papaver somniferum]|uniref:F-box protein At5g39450-like n=1 Tax=Papaver somniferum TaxID=3469 RepID=UPI000E703F5D|nr:F-box protein At5g39450-like [Papaver somniferum]
MELGLLHDFLYKREKLWSSQCESLNIANPPEDVVEWRTGVTSYKCLCKFMFTVQPLLGIWVHQNPEIGNLVYVMPGFLSFVGCRILPQQLGPLGLQDGSLLWAPVFEIISDMYGELAFFLHGQETDGEYLYPGAIKPVDRSCNVLLLEVEPRMQNNECKLLRSKSLGHPRSDWESMRRNHRSDDGGFSSSQRAAGSNSSVIAFDRLAFKDRQELLELITSQVGSKVPLSDSGPLIPRFGDGGDGFKKDFKLLSERRLLLLKKYQHGGGYTNLQTISMEVAISKLKKRLETPSSTGEFFYGDEIVSKRRSVAGYLKDRLKPILGKFISTGGLVNPKKGSLSSDLKHYSSELHEFLLSGDMIGFSVHASTVKLPTNSVWPKMHDEKHALYKLPTWIPTSGQEYAGLWGGTFGWPHGRSSEVEGKALFFLLLSYEESEGKQLLIAPRILEGTEYAYYPNGSTMFTVKVNELSADPFPLETDGEFSTLDIIHTYAGEGLAEGDRFQDPGSKPGSLFVNQNGLLAFVWKETRAVLTLQRINLQDLLRKGKRVPALPPTLNFTFQTQWYSNALTRFSNFPTAASCLYIAACYPPRVYN